MRFGGTKEWKKLHGNKTTMACGSWEYIRATMGFLPPSKLN